MYRMDRPAGEGFFGLADFWLHGEAAHEARYGSMTQATRFIERAFHKFWFAQDGVHLLPEELVTENVDRKTALFWDERFRGGVPLAPFLQPYHGVHIVKSG